MRNYIVVLFFLVVSTQLTAQTSPNTLIINNKNDIVNTANNQIISFYLKGLTNQQINSFNSKIAAVNGVKLFFLKTTDANLKMSYGKLQLQNKYDKKGLIKFLKQYNIEAVVVEGMPTNMNDFFSKREGGVIIR